MENKGCGRKERNITNVSFWEWGSISTEPAVPPSVIDSIPTMDELFDDIQTAIDTNQLSSAYYNYQYGNPQYVRIDSPDPKLVPPLDVSIVNMLPLNETLKRRDELQAARNKWQDDLLTEYQYVLDIVAFAPPDLLKPILVQVEGGVVSQAKYTDGTELPPGWIQPKPVPELYDMIETAIDQHVPRLDVEYDASYAHPTSIVIDYNEQIADEELYWYISEFLVLGRQADNTKPPCQHTIGGCQDLQDGLEESEISSVASEHGDGGGGGLRQRKMLQA